MFDELDLDLYNAYWYLEMEKKIKNDKISLFTWTKHFIKIRTEF